MCENTGTIGQITTVTGHVHAQVASQNTERGHFTRPGWLLIGRKDKTQALELHLAPRYSPMLVSLCSMPAPPPCGALTGRSKCPEAHSQAGSCIVLRL